MNSEELNKIDQSIVAKSRQVLEQYGKYWGKQIYSVGVSNLDMDYNSDVMNDKNTLRKPLRIYTIKTYNILGGTLVMDANDEPVIQFNGDPDLRFPLLPPTFAKAETATVADAVAAIESGKSIIFFDKRIPLQKEVAALNKGVLKITEDLSRKYAKFSGTIVDMIKAEETASKEYLSQCGVDEAGNKLVVEVEIGG